MPRGVIVLGWRAGPGATGHLSVFGPDRFEPAGCNVMRPEDVEPAEGVESAVDDDESFARANEVEHRAFCGGAPTRALVIQDEHVEVRKRRGGDAGRLLLDAHVEPSAVGQQLSKIWRGSAPVVVVLPAEYQCAHRRRRRKGGRRQQQERDSSYACAGAPVLASSPSR